MTQKSLLLLAVLTLTAPAWAQPAAQSAQPQTESSGTITVNQTEAGGVNRSTVNTHPTELLEYMTDKYMDEYDKKKVVLYNMVEQARVLDHNLRLSTGGYRLVEIEGETGVGKSSVVRMHAVLSGDAVFSLDLEKFEELRRKDPKQAATKLDEALTWLKKTADKTPEVRVILHVKNASVLKSSLNGATTLQIFAEALADRSRLYTIIEKHSLAFKDNEVWKRYPEIDSTKITQRVIDASFETNYSYIKDNVGRMEAHYNKEVSLDAIEEVARLKTRYFSDKTIEFTWELLAEATKEAIKDAKGGKTRGNEAELKETIAKLESDIDRLQREVKAAKNDHEKLARYQKRLDSAGKQLIEANESLANLGNVDSLKAEEAKHRARLMVLEMRKEWLEARHKRYGSITRPFDQKLRGVNNEIREETNKARGLETAIKTFDTGARVEAKHVLRVVSNLLNIPVARLQASFSEGLANFDNHMESKIFGQDDALKAIKNALLVRHTHLNDGKEIESFEQALKVSQGLLDDSIRPISSFWFAGNTGVGKTETAVQLAELLGLELFRWDMSEFGQAHYISRLIGSTSGYVDSDKEGEMTGKVRKMPDCVILLDEIEKAHPDIFKILLQIIDAGRLTDNHGTVKFGRVIFIVTSNLAQDIGKMSMNDLLFKFATYNVKDKTAKTFEAITNDLKAGKMTMEEAEAKMTAEIDSILKTTEEGRKVLARVRNDKTGEIDKSLLQSEVYRSTITDPVAMEARGYKAIPPEVAARFDQFIMFQDLDNDIALKIFEKNLQSLINRLQYFYEIPMKFSQDAYEAMRKRFNNSEGGRSMRRVVLNLLAAPLATMIFEKTLKPGQVAFIDAQAPESDPDKIRFTREAIERTEFNKVAAANKVAPQSGPSVVTAGMAEQVKNILKSSGASAGAKGPLTQAAEQPHFILSRETTQKLRGMRGRSH